MIDMTSYVQDGGHDVISRPPPLAVAPSTGCPLACQARVTSVPDP